MEPIIKVENLGKSYIIGHQREKYVALRDVLTNKARQVVSKTKNIFSGGQLIAGNEMEEFWALKDINFEVNQGDRVGIIGRNGAGKSTLLKVLSRITEPTTGRIHLKGRVASLLEVGTGFHPELSGRENIYLNGAILGMSRAEVKKKFDEIVDFAGVEKFLDTPVKRYSSGMYVRLAFAVAAHLEPEILIVDEVLAVGDAEFQKKCLGKMEDVSKNDGRTVLFVSHNMGAIMNLCNNGILLKSGQVDKFGNIKDVVEEYLSSSIKSDQLSYTKRLGNKKAEFLDYKLCDSSGKLSNEFFMGDDIWVHLKIKFNEKLSNIDLGINIKNHLGELITHITNLDDCLIVTGEKDEIKSLKIKLCNIYFSPSKYALDIAVLKGNDHFDMLEECLSFSLIEGEKIKRGYFPSHIKVYSVSKWEIQ
jgi:lipopolysaccharide transport system ATP-binding protein